MNESSPFDHDSLMYKLMKYLYKIEEQMESVPLIWVIVDTMQFLTIVVSLLGQVIKVQYSLEGQGLFSNFLNIFFNYNTVYSWLVISGAASAFVVVLGIIAYLIIEYHQEIKKTRKNQVLTYCALTATITIGLFQFFSQVMANNLINIVTGILAKSIDMNVDLIGFFLLNMGMMIFVSIFNSQRRIFRFCLILVSLGLNILPFTLTCLLIFMLSLYYQKQDKVRYKKLFYFLIIVTCVWSGLEINDQEEYFLGSRFIYFGMACCGVVLYFVYYQECFMEDCSTDQNKYLVELYKKKLKKQDKKQDYLLANQYFTKYYEKQSDEISNCQNNKTNTEFYLTQSVQEWHESDLKQRIIEKIKSDRRQNSNQAQSRCEIHYFEFLIELKMDMVNLLREVFEYMNEKKNDNFQTIFQINRLANRIEKQFNQEVPSAQDQVLKVDSIINLQRLFQDFYSRYANIVEILQDIFDSLLKQSGHILESTEEKLANFTQQQKLLQKTLLQIQTITPSNLETKLYKLLSQLWDNYKKNEQNTSLKSVHSDSALQTTQKFSFSYVVISNKTIKYASIKFLSTYSYKQSYIIGQNISMIFPSKFSSFVIELLEKNADKKVFHSQVPIINQKGFFQVVNATFYLLPQFKGQITYILLLKKNPQLQTKSLLLFNSETLCIEGFNRRMINKFKFSIDKINLALQNGAIQFSNLFIFNNDEKDFLTFTQKNSSSPTTRINKKITEFGTIDKNKQQEKLLTMKAMLKMDYLSDIKKSSGKNVNLQAQISFQINNISYKVIKVEDNSNERTPELTLPIERTQQLNIIKEINQRSDKILQKSTKDLKKKYQNQQFFCPIPNPYLPKILEQMNSFETSGRLTNFMLIRIFFTVSLVLFLGGMIGIRVSSQNLLSQIIQFQREAQSLNRQYSYFMEGILHVYEIYHMERFPSQFKTYIEQNYGLSTDEAVKFYNDELTYLYAEKTQIIKKYQDAYFNFPILWDSPSVQVVINAGLFVLQSTSHTTLSYDLVVFLLDSSSVIIQQVISMNYGLYTTLIKVLRPDGRYNDKIQGLSQTPADIILTSLSVLTVICGLLYYWLYQLRVVREEIISIYQFIEKRQIITAKKKVSDIQDLIQILSNNKQHPIQQNTQNTQKTEKFHTLSELNSATNLVTSEKLKQNDNVKSFDDDSHTLQTQSQNNQLLQKSEDQNSLKKKISLKKKVVSTSKGIEILVGTFLKYPIYLILLLLNLGVLFLSYYIIGDKSSQYTQAFGYFQKVRAANFQFRYLYAKSQQLAFFESVQNLTFIDLSPVTESDKKTQFAYEKPDGFAFLADENLCSTANLVNLTDPWFASYDCKAADDEMLTRQFSQAYEQYERNLRLINNATYQQLITDPTLTEIYFNCMYEYHIFKNYFNQLSESNFQINIDYMTSSTQQMFTYMFYFVVLWIILTFLFVFIVVFTKLEAEISTIISLIKIIPSETLFNMKVASLFKKKDLITKLSRL